MSAKTKLWGALKAIDDAKSSLKRAQNNVEDNHDIRRAISELEDAEADVKRAISDLPEE